MNMIAHEVMSCFGHKETGAKLPWEGLLWEGLQPRQRDLQPQLSGLKPLPQNQTLAP